MTLLTVKRPSKRSGVCPLDYIMECAMHNGWEPVKNEAETEISLVARRPRLGQNLVVKWEETIRAYRVVSYFDFPIKKSRRSDYFELLNLLNNLVITGNFEYCPHNKITVFRAMIPVQDLRLTEEEFLSAQINLMMQEAENFHPALFFFSHDDDVSPVEVTQSLILTTEGNA